MKERYLETKLLAQLLGTVIFLMVGAAQNWLLFGENLFWTLALVVGVWLIDSMVAQQVDCRAAMLSKQQWLILWLLIAVEITGLGFFGGHLSFQLVGLFAGLHGVFFWAGPERLRRLRGVLGRFSALKPAQRMGLIALAFLVLASLGTDGTAKNQYFGAGGFIALLWAFVGRSLEPMDEA